MIEQTTIQNLTPDNLNANKHTQQGMRVLEKSISKLGLGRSILLDKDNRIIAGNGVVETSASLGIENVRIIDSDGTDIIAVRRNDISLDSKLGRELALVDNHTAQIGIDLDRKVLLEYQKEFEVDLDFYEVNVESQLANSYDYSPNEYDEEKVPYPITIIVNKSDYEQWLEVKEKLGVENDKQAFFKILGESYL